MKKIIISFLCIMIVMTVNATEFLKSSNSSYLLYGTIPFVKAANFKRYTEQINRNINQERDLLHNYLLNLVNVTGDIRNAISAVSAIESLSNYSSRISTKGFEQYFSNKFISTISNLYRQYNLKELKIKLTQDAQQADLIGAGVYSITPSGLFAISFQLLNLKNNRIESFYAEGNYKRAISNIAFQIFKFFEETRALPLKNPTPKKRWITSSPLNFKILSTKSEAVLFCRDQGARIPTGRELKTAHLMGTIGGGIILPRNKFIHVQDIDQYGDNTYYYTSTPSSGRKRIQRWVSNVINDLAYFVCIKDM